MRQLERLDLVPPLTQQRVYYVREDIMKRAISVRARAGGTRV